MSVVFFSNMTNLELVRAVELAEDPHSPELVKELATRLHMITVEYENFKERVGDDE